MRYIYSLLCLFLLASILFGQQKSDREVVRYKDDPPNAAMSMSKTRNFNYNLLKTSAISWTLVDSATNALTSGEGECVPLAYDAGMNVLLYTHRGDVTSYSADA